MVTQQLDLPAFLGFFKKEFADPKVLKFELLYPVSWDANCIELFWKNQKATYNQKHVKQFFGKISKKCCVTTSNWEQNLQDFWLMADMGAVLQNAAASCGDQLTQKQVVDLMEKTTFNSQPSSKRQITINAIVLAMMCRLLQQKLRLKLFSNRKQFQSIQNSRYDAKQKSFGLARKLIRYNTVISLYYELIELEIKRITDEKLETDSSTCCKLQLVSQFIKMDIPTRLRFIFISKIIYFKCLKRNNSKCANLDKLLEELEILVNACNIIIEKLMFPIERHINVKKQIKKDEILARANQLVKETMPQNDD
ncbi:hypothetical protein M3Y97_01110300 [Aphelenchoides bicaudatus]|nr:hypothetical protein M3Y97_01110300 [Aphelenchoides bicaudatus]